LSPDHLGGNSYQSSRRVLANTEWSGVKLFVRRYKLQFGNLAKLEPWSLGVNYFRRGCLTVSFVKGSGVKHLV